MNEYDEWVMGNSYPYYIPQDVLAEQEGYTLWPGPHDETQSFVYHADPKRWHRRHEYERWMLGIPLDYEIPYI